MRVIILAENELNKINIEREVLAIKNILNKLMFLC